MQSNCPARARSLWLGYALGLLALLLAQASIVVAAEPATPRYRVDVVAPSELRDALLRQLDLIHWQSVAEVSDEFLRHLVTDAREQARDIAATLGYFSAQVGIELDENATPAQVRLSVEPGEPTRVIAVDIKVEGPAAIPTADNSAQIAAINAHWRLPQGAVFTQAKWDDAKAGALRELSSDRYAAAQITASKADIDPDAHAARLAITLDSGPVFHFGELTVTGLVKYPESFVRDLASFAPGEPYSQQRLDQFVRRLNATGYFASAHARIDDDPARADAAPVRVSVVEGATKTISFGLGYSTDTLYRATMSYSDANLDKSGLRFRTDLRLEGKVQNASVQFMPVPSTPGHTDVWAGKVERTDISGLVTQEIVGGWSRHTTDERDETGYAVRYYVSRQEPSGAPSSDAHALYAAYDRSWRQVDDLLSPTRGWMLNAEIGGGPPGVSTEAFARGVVRGLLFIPFDTVTGLTLRAEAGAVASDTRQGVPSALLFRTGGDTTVRGYEFESLGPREGNATVGGRYYALASAEVVRWIGESWGIAAFVDAGNAADSPRDLHLALGYGIGARIRTPIGPFRFDVAYGQETHGVRVHLSIGVTF
jgi:translocation and assembly module TamA